MKRGNTGKFEQKRVDILDAAATLINQHGVKGMTFVDVARAVGLNTTSVTYYFKRKEQLAEAAFDHSLDRIEDMVERAGEGPTARDRVNAYLKLTFDRYARIRQGEERPIAVLSDMRTLDEPVRQRLVDRYTGIFRKLRGFFPEPVTERQRRLATVRAHIFLENLFWLPAWLTRYSVSDMDRVLFRIQELFDHGIALSGAKWSPEMLGLERSAEADTAREDFIRAATVLINQRGYRGASVDRIAAELNVTKGSFYHHLDAKDDLVMECFRRSYSRVSEAQGAAMAVGGDHWHKISSAIATLLDIQLYQPFPLLRTTALQALPEDVRGEVVDRSNRMARRFAGMLIDGITEGSIRPIDPLIASQLITAGLNAAFEVRRWAGQMDRETAIEAYASILVFGLYTDS